MNYKKDGMLFFNEEEAVDEICVGKSCNECPLYERVGRMDCADWAEDNPEEFAKACGFENVREAPLYEETRISAKQAQETYEKLTAAQAAKADAGKLQIHLVPMQIVRDICEVREYGNKKYGDPENWRQVELMRYVDALLRHTLAFANDIHSVDEESGIPHYKHMECNLAFISEMMADDKR